MGTRILVLSKDSSVMRITLTFWTDWPQNRPYLISSVWTLDQVRAVIKLNVISGDLSALSLKSTLAVVFLRQSALSTWQSFFVIREPIFAHTVSNSFVHAYLPQYTLKALWTTRETVEQRKPSILHVHLMIAGTFQFKMVKKDPKSLLKIKTNKQGKKNWRLSG